MKTLLLLRHAKSSRSDSTLADHDRPLNKRGSRAAPRMGQLLRERDLLPDRVLSSSAKRALDTAQAVIQASRSSVPLEVHRDLYLSSPNEYAEVLRHLPDRVERALVVGHNPDLEELLEQLTGAHPTLPTAALAWLVLPITRWRDLELDARAEVRRIWRVKELD